MQGADDADLRWRPGSDHLPPDAADDVDLDHRHSGATTSPPSAVTPLVVSASPVADLIDDGAIDTSSSTGGDRRPRSARAVAWVAMAGVAAAAVAVVVTSASDGLAGSIASTPRTVPVEPIAPTDVAFAGADPRRLPDELGLRWVTTLPFRTDPSSTVVAHRDGIVVAVFDAAAPCEEPSATCSEDGVEPSSAIVGLDTTDGTEAWEVTLPTRPRSLDVLGVLDDVVVVEWLDLDNRALLGFDASDGRQLWRLDSNDVGIHGVLFGTELIGRFSFTSSPRLTLIDPATGDVAGRAAGRLVATDFSGRWWIRSAARDSGLSLLDLRDGWSTPQPLDVDVTSLDVVTVVDDQVIGVRDGRLVVPAGGRAWRDAEVTVADGVESDARPRSVIAMSPAAGSSVVMGDGSHVFGASVDGDLIEIRWIRRGVVASSTPSDRGLLLVIANEGGASQRVIDASTGRVLTEVQMIPGAIDGLRLVGNGIVTKRRGDLGPERVALDLDGRRVWSLVGEGPFVLGTDVVVTWTEDVDGVRLAAYG